MSGTGLTVPDITGSLRRHDVTVTVDSDGGHLANLAEFAMAAEEVASVRGACIVTAHTVRQITCVVTVQGRGVGRCCG